MKRWQRRIVNRTADRLEGLVEWLRKKAERPTRPRPLRLPTASELLMQDMMETTMRHLTGALVKSVYETPKIVRIMSEDTLKPVHIRWPSDN